MTILTQCVASYTLSRARCALSTLSLSIVSSGAAIAVVTAFKKRNGMQRHMELAAAIWTRFRARPFNAAVLILALSVSGWTQQAPPASQKHQAAKRHTEPSSTEIENTVSALPCLNRGKATGSCGQIGKAVSSRAMAPWSGFCDGRGCKSGTQNGRRKIPEKIRQS